MPIPLLHSLIVEQLLKYKSDSEDKRMERTYLLKGLDCPNCAAKIEREAGRLPGVTDAVVNLMKQTLTVRVDPDAASEADGGELLSAIERIVHAHEPDVKVSEKGAGEAAERENIGILLPVIIAVTRSPRWNDGSAFDSAAGA